MFVERNFKKYCVICDWCPERKEFGCFFCMNDAWCKDDRFVDLAKRNKMVCMPMDDTGIDGQKLPPISRKNGISHQKCMVQLSRS